MPKPTLNTTINRSKSVKNDDDYTQMTRIEKLILSGKLPNSAKGCGCIWILVVYYTFGLNLLRQANWHSDWFSAFWYCVGPLAWPVALSGWVSSQLHQTFMGILGLGAYAFLLHRMFRAKSRITIFLAMVGILLLFLAAVGGCCESFNRSF